MPSEASYQASCRASGGAMETRWGLPSGGSVGPVCPSDAQPTKGTVTGAFADAPAVRADCANIPNEAQNSIVPNAMNEADLLRLMFLIISGHERTFVIPDP